MDEIARLAALQGAEINEAKKVLATEATALLHGREAAEKAAETARKTFEQGAHRAGSADASRCRAPNSTPGIGVLAAFVESRPRRLQRRGAAPDQGRRPARQRRRRDRREDGADRGRPHADGVIKLSLGKKKHVLLRPA